MIKLNRDRVKESFGETVLDRLDDSNLKKTGRFFPHLAADGCPLTEWESRTMIRCGDLNNDGYELVAVYLTTEATEQALENGDIPCLTPDHFYIDD